METKKKRVGDAKVATDALQLPLPPLSLDFAIRADSSVDGFLQRYIRKGDSYDAASAVVGKGGFGTAYRYTRDDSFTPPSSFTEAQDSCDNPREDLKEEEQVEALRRPSVQLRGACEMSRYTATEEVKEAINDSEVEILQRHPRQIKSCDTISPGNTSAPSSPIRQVARNKAPAVIVVKVCRTPTSGSYDELPKTGKGREEAKKAAQELANGVPRGEHTRIVRGEARLLRYLQMAQTIRRKKGQPSFVVRLLADIPLPHNDGTSRDAEDTYSGPPIPRLLIFERLVDLDAELTSKGWARNKKLWTVEKVEAVSRDVVAGLKFLHEHNVVHGDLKPSNFMRDPKTGHVKLIDLGASRRWVRLPNQAKERTSAVEELDQAVKNGIGELSKPGDILCEGLGSLTGSPHFMAPEVLLQAGRYLSAEGQARSILDDYMVNKEHLPNVPSADLLDDGYRDFRRGWGIKADLWSWGCSTISLLLRTIPHEKRPSSGSICAFDFSFDDDRDALTPIWPLHASNDTLPRFHLWARMYPLRIMSILQSGVVLPECTSVFGQSMLRALRATFQQQDRRLSARDILDILDLDKSTRAEPALKSLSGSSRSSLTAHSVELHRLPSSARSCTSLTPSAMSHPDEMHNIDLSTSVAISVSHSNLGHDGTSRMHSSQQSFIMLDVASRRKETSSPVHRRDPQQKYMQERPIQSPLASSGGSSSAVPSPHARHLASLQSAAAAMDLSPQQNTIPLPSPAHRPAFAIQSSLELQRVTSYQPVPDQAVEELHEDGPGDNRRTSTVPPLPPAARLRQVGASFEAVVPSITSDRARRENRAGWAKQEDSSGQFRLRPKLSFPQLMPKKRQSFLWRVASQLSPRQFHMPTNHQVEESQSRQLSSVEVEQRVRDRRGSMYGSEMLVDSREALFPQGQGMTPSLSGTGSNASSSAPDHRPTSSFGSDSRMEHFDPSLQSPPSMPSSPLTPTNMLRPRLGTEHLSPRFTRANLPSVPASMPRSSTSSLGHAGSPSNAASGYARSFKPSPGGVLGLGLDLHIPALRTVRSFSSSRGRSTHSSHTPQQSPCRPHSDAAELCNDSSAQKSDFLQHDPYAASSAQHGDGFAAYHHYTQQPQQQRRGRSWSSIFKRKKVL